MIGDIFGWVMYFCYRITHNYGVTIIFFTLLMKIILLPISVMVQKNSIKIVKLYPEMNHIKAKFYGNKDLISEAQYHLYKKEKYHPMLDLVPVVMQFVILIGVIDVIYNPLEHLLHLDQSYINIATQAYSSLNNSTESKFMQIQLIDYLLQSGNSSSFSTILPNDVIEQITSLNLFFCGFNLGVVPILTGNISILVPLLAAISSYLLCYTQNKVNVLQSEQSISNKIFTLTLSVGLSLYLGFFVPAGVGFYWIISNLMAIAMVYILNYCINPKKYIDYNALEDSKQELEQMQKYMSTPSFKKNKEYLMLEKKDYMRFSKYKNKQIVFFSEKNGFYKYFQNVIELILKKTDIIIHYITSDPHDEVFKLQNDNFQVYYIGEKKLIILMLKMDADMVVMTMPDLQKYHIKRSIVRDDIEYIYMSHGIGSYNLMLRKHAIDYFDTIFVPNEIDYKEIRKMENAYGVKPKTLVKYGFALIDNMIAHYECQVFPKSNTKNILIAPSWQKDNILDLCIDEVLNNLLKSEYQIILRPHPQYIRHFSDMLSLLEKKYAHYANFKLQMDFSSNDTVYNADILITDWSGIAYEYSFTTLKPSLFINTPMKVMNPDYQEIDIVPFDIEIRNQIGISVDITQLNTLSNVVEKLLTENCYSQESIHKIREKYLYNVSKSAKVGSDYIINRLIEMSQR